MKTKHKINLSPFRKLNKEFNERLANEMAKFNIGIFEKMFYEASECYTAYLYDEVTYEEVVGEMTMLLLYGKEISVYEDDMDIDDLEEIIKKIAFETKEKLDEQEEELG